MWRHGVRFSSSRAAWREDVAVRGSPAPITRRSCFCSGLEVGVGAMRLSLRKRTILSAFLRGGAFLGVLLIGGLLKGVGEAFISRAEAESDVS